MSEDRPLTYADKSFPPSAWGRSSADLAADGVKLSAFETPVFTLDSAAMDRNVARMARWVGERGLDLAPHGKTTMAPDLWRRQLDAGAWGITLATGWQVQVARQFGTERILLANTLVDPVALTWISGELDAHPDFEFFCWADSVEALERMEDVLGPLRPTRPVNVLVDLGAAGGRTGARSVEQALAVARRISASTVLSLAGAGGYEGSLAHDRRESGLARVGSYLDSVVALHRALIDEGLYNTSSAVITAGGSAYFDSVADRLGVVVDRAGERGIPTRVVLRSGAYMIHDDGFYRDVSPFGRAASEGMELEAAMHCWARVLSRPEPGLAIFDAGRRDVPFDEGLPIPQRVVGYSEPESERMLAGSEVTKLNDQHGYLSLPAPAGPEVLTVGSVIRFGLSHPCTAMDKWRAVPLINDAHAADPTVVGAVRTYF